MHDALTDIATKVERAERLTFEDGVRLFETRDIHALGHMANVVRERLHGMRTFYNVNRHINYTNYCVLRCKFCSFYRPYGKTARVGADGGNVPALEPQGLPIADGPGDSDGYEVSVDEVIDRARQAYAHGATEVHIVGGLHPNLPLSYYEAMCEGIRQACPKIHIKAFTAIEIIHFTRISKPRRTISEVLTRLRAAGLDSLPGGGAEIFDDRVHEEAYKNKVGEKAWFDVHVAAHELGIPSNATMLYGHIESRADRVRHMIKLREQQDVSIAERKARFNCFIPLSFIPAGSEFADLPGPTGLDDLKTLAVSRLMLDNVSHIKAFWIMQTPKLAQVSLNWGVDDLDGTVVYYDITKREGDGTTHQELTVDKLQRLIYEAGRVPVERDSLYRRVVRRNGDWSIQAAGS